MKRKDTDSGLQRGNVIGFTCQVIFLESKGNNSCKRFLAVVNYLKYCITKASEKLCLKRCFAQLGGKQMARKCFITGKKTKAGNNRSHAMNASKRTWGANLQKVRILVDGKPKKVYVSARALKSGKVERV